MSPSDLNLLGQFERKETSILQRFPVKQILGNQEIQWKSVKLRMFPADKS